MYKSLKINRFTFGLGIIFVVMICFSVLYSGISPEIQPVTAQENGIKLPIIMYHGILNDTKLQGQYVISPSQFEDDLKKITSEGYTTVTVENLINYVYNDKNLPEKPIMITFDDGYYNNYLYAYPLLKKYNCCAVISPIAYYSEYYSNSTDKLSASYFHCSWSQLKEMIDSGYVEIQNHSYNMHSQSDRLGLQRKQGEDINIYKSEIKNDISTAQKMFKDKLGITPVAFVYPFGEFNSTSEEIIKEMSFKCTMICDEKMNIITKDKECLYKLGRFLRTNTITSNELFNKFEK